MELETAKTNITEEIDFYKDTDLSVSYHSHDSDNTQNDNKVENILDISNHSQSSYDNCNDGNNIIHDLKTMRCNNAKNIIVGHLIVNSLRNKFLSIKELLASNIDIFLLSETKLDDSFPINQFRIEGYWLFRYDRSRFGGGLCLYVHEDIPCREIECVFLQGNEFLCVEINLRKRKWLIIGLYKPPQNNTSLFLEQISNQVNESLKTYENILLIGDFNITPDNIHMKDFLHTHDFENLVKSPTCFKSDTPSCIDLILTNQSQLLMKTSTFETGISDFHALITSIMKMTYTKGNPNIKLYRDYKHFNNVNFEEEIHSKFRDIPNITYDIFEETYLKVLDNHAPIKKKILRSNENPFMTKALRKAIMVRSKLKKKFLKNRSKLNWRKYKNQRNFCTNLLKQTKRNYFSNLNLSSLSDSRKFWKKIKPLFSDKGASSNKIIICDNENIISDEKKVADLMNNHFTNITKELNLKPDVIPDKRPYTLDSIIDKFKDHKSIKIIKTFHNIPKNAFTFKEVSTSEIENAIKDLKINKGSLSNCIPAKIIKENSSTCILYLKQLINESILSSTFPNKLKLAEVIPIYKKGDPLDKENYRPISLLSHVSKIYERILFNQINDYIEPYLSELLTGFRKNHGTQHSLMRMIEDWKKLLDKGYHIGVVYMDLSKAFDVLKHDLLLAKLEAYGFTYDSIRYIQSYLTDRMQRTNVNSQFSIWEKTHIGVPQGSILGPLFFNIYINDIFHFVNKCTLCNYADDNTMYTYDRDLSNLKVQINLDFENLDLWFDDNYMVLNPKKCEFMYLGKSKESQIINYKQYNLKAKETKVLLGVVIDNKLSFKDHVSSICKKASRKMNALNRISSLLNYNEKITILNSFIQSQFNYCPLVWMFCLRASNNKINKIHERALRVCQNDYVSTFENLLYNTNSLDIHSKNIQKLMIEIYKCLNHLSPPIMKNFFTIRENCYNLRNFRDLESGSVKTVNCGLNTILYRGPQLWQQVPEYIKNSENLNLFKSRLKSWQNFDCPCNTCKIYIKGLGYM